MKNIEIGDLVRIMYSSIPDEQPTIGLVMGISNKGITAYTVLTEGREILLPFTRVEALCK